MCGEPFPRIRIFGGDAHVRRAVDVLEILEPPGISLADWHWPVSAYRLRSQPWRQAVERIRGIEVAQHRVAGHLHLRHNLEMLAEQKPSTGVARDLENFG